MDTEGEATNEVNPTGSLYDEWRALSDEEFARRLQPAGWGPDTVRWICDEALRRLATRAAPADATIPMVLLCPACGHQHVDAPEPDKGWTNPPHKSHLCAACGVVWRPADVPTTGVAAIATRGKADTWDCPRTEGRS